MSSTRRFCVSLTILALLAGLALRPDVSRAQPQKRPPVQVEMDTPASEEQTFDGLSIPKDREATSIISAAREYVIKKDWDTVARSLQFLLEKPEDSFFEVARKDDKGKEYIARISIRIEANRLIGELPPEGLETYRQKYGQRAMNMLQDGIDKNDAAVMSQVALRYRHTEAGVKAIQLLGNYFLDRGNYQLASGKFQELLELLENEKPEVKKEVAPKTFFKAALAYQRFGDTEMANRLWKQVVELVGDKGLAFGKTIYTMAQLKAEFDRNAQVGSKTLASVQVLRGDASRTAQLVGGTPFLDPRFSVSMFVPDKSKEKDADSAGWLKTSEWVQEKIRGATDMLEKSSTARRALLPGYFPVAANNRLIFRTYDGVYAYYLRDDAALGVKAGEIAWAQPTDGSLHAMGSDQGGFRGTFEGWWGQSWGSMAGGAAMPSILFENSSVGTLSHDNGYVYYVDDLAMPPHPNQTMYGFNGQASPFGAFTDKVLFNSLRAVNLETGCLEWEIGGRKAGSKFPVINQPGMGIRRVIGANGKVIQIGPDGKEIEIDPKTGQPVKKPEEPAKPFVPPKDVPETKGFVNAADELLDSYFLGPPLPIGGKIYVLIEYNGEIQLCCINPKRQEKCKVFAVNGVVTGNGPELVWRQPLGTASFKLMQDSMRRIQPCHLAYSDGILICPTNAGAIIAVNLLTQSLAWAYSYRTSNPNTDPTTMPPGAFRGGRIRNMGMVVNMAAERWHSAPPAIANGSVVFTASDGSALVCLSLRDGKRLWQVNRQQGDLYMAGVYNNKVLIVAKDSIRALKLSDGTPAWNRSRPIGMPSGQGVASKGKYFLPCKNGVDSPDPQILEIDIDTGDAHATKSRKKDVPGNLMFFDGEVVSQNIWAISTYPQLHVKLAEMNARLAKNPNDPQGLVDRGELHLDKGELALAIKDLKTALTFKPDPDTRAKARLKLYESLTELLQKDFNQGEEHLDLYRDLCTNDIADDDKLKRQSAYLCILGKGREAQGKLVEAFDAYMQFGQLNNAREMVPSVDEPGTLARPDVWARGRILAMIAKAKPEEKKPLEERVSRQWAVVKSSNDVEKIKGFVQVFGSMFESGLEARLALAERFMVSSVADDQRQAELYLDMLRRQRDNPEMAARATEMMARFMVKKGLLRDAVLLYRLLGTEFKDVKLPDGRTGADIYNELVTDKRFLPYLDAGSLLWGPGRMKGEQVTGPYQNNVQSYFTVEPDGELLPFFRQHRLVIDTQTPSGNGMWQIRLLDRATGAERWKSANLPPNHFLLNQNFGGPNANSSGGVRFAQVRGHILMLTMQHMVYAWDLVDQKKLWEVNLLGKGTINPQLMETRTDADGTIRLMYADGTRIRVGQMGILESSYVCLPTREGLVAMDPATGVVLWKREAGSGAHLFGDSEYIFVVESGDDGAPARTQVVRAADGVSVKASDFSSLFHPSRRIATVGRSILVFDGDNAEKVLRLHDVLTDKDVWRQSFPEGTKVVRSEQQGIAGVVQPDGTLTIVDIASGKSLLTTKEADDKIVAEHLTNVRDLILLQDRERYYIALNRAPDANTQAYPFVSNGLRSLRIHGTLYAYDKASGHFEWYRDEVANQFLIMEHMEDLPILIFGSMVNRNNQAQGANIEAVEKRSGKLFFNRQIPNNGQFYAMHADPRLGVIELMRYDLKIRFAQEGSPAEKDPKIGAMENSLPVGPVGAQPVRPAIGNIRVMPAQRIQIQVAPAIPLARPVAPVPPVPPRPAEKPADKPK